MKLKVSKRHIVKYETMKLASIADKPTCASKKRDNSELYQTSSHSAL